MRSFFKNISFFTTVSLLLTACNSGRAVLHYSLDTRSSAVAQTAMAHSSFFVGQTQAIVPVYVATSRNYENNVIQPFGDKRSKQLHFALVDVAIPLIHRKGVVEKNGRQPNQDKHFIAVSFGLYTSRQTFKSALKTAIAHHTGKKKEIFLFIHGYNNNFAESTFRTAQIVHDYNIDAVIVHYAWPSGGEVGLYIYDRDSADFARNGLTDLLQLLTEINANQITVVAHSMGNYVMMEALRTLSLKGQHQVIHRISSLLMAAPDIDVDVFEQQLRDVRHLPKATVVQISSVDKALKISRKITGGHARLGDGSSIDFLQRHGISVLDMSHVDGGTHSVFASSPTLMALVKEGALSHPVLQGDSGRLSNNTLLLYTPTGLFSWIRRYQ
ncbi:MAG: hypothetical protein JSC085_000397 [Candidatus Tokpelaia sp. JSC085]|nr:MAG: hypothetical protein JSC085_000397 [Candidatus Tokpelaia sp. JSC085]